MEGVCSPDKFELFYQGNPEAEPLCPHMRNAKHFEPGAESLQNIYRKILGRVNHTGRKYIYAKGRNTGPVE